MTESAFDRDSILVAERPYFGPRQIKDRREIKEGATIICVDRAGERPARVTRKPWRDGKDWVFEVEYLDGPTTGRGMLRYLGDYSVVPQRTPRGNLWNRTNHILYAEKPCHTQKLTRTAGILILIGAALLIAGLFFNPPSILLGGIGVTLAVVALAAAVAGYREAGK